ncbi:hypothetical protein ACIBK8_28690 [Streptomyces sp. NPDC050161]|uniref:hypothetical protein n=1 Tax=Streptomyces sp. NPDC050161 TaxID=3365604 RepID=UPI00378ACAC5
MRHPIQTGRRNRLKAGKAVDRSCGFGLFQAIGVLAFVAAVLIWLARKYAALSP